MKHYDAGRKQWDDTHIKALRKHLGLTQQEMADRLGTRQQTISEWELGLYRLLQPFSRSWQINPVSPTMLQYLKRTVPVSLSIVKKQRV